MTWLAAVINGCLYRMGGIGRPFRSWMRDWLIPGVMIFLLSINYHIPIWQWRSLIYYALCGVSLTTYWDSVPFNKGKDNFYMHGFFIGLSLITYIGIINIWLILLASIFTAISLGVWNLLFGKLLSFIPYNDWIDEIGRGALISISLFLADKIV